MTSVHAVGRIAYLTADILVESLPQLPTVSAFASTFKELSDGLANRPNLISVPYGADPAASIFRATDVQLIAFCAPASSSVVTSLSLRLTDLSNLPLVIHLSVQDDLSDVLLLRSAIPFFIISSTAQQAHDNALLASKLARKERKAVVHVFYDAHLRESISEVAGDSILPFIWETTPHTNGHALPGPIPNGVPSTEEDGPHLGLFKVYEATALSTLSLLRRPLPALDTRGSTEPHTVLITLGSWIPPLDIEGVSFISVSLLNPLPQNHLLKAIPESATRVIVLEQVHHWWTKWTPLYLDVVKALQSRDPRPGIQSGLLGDTDHLTSTDVLKLLELEPSTPHLHLGTTSRLIENDVSFIPHVPKHEQAYTKILRHLFGDRLDICNDPTLVPTLGKLATTPEFALGRARELVDRRTELVTNVQELMASGLPGSSLHALLSKWTLGRDDIALSRVLGDQIVQTLEAGNLRHPSVDAILSLRAHFPSVSRWIIGSDAWSYDIGSSGLHHAIASGLDLNILILDTLPYSSRNEGDLSRRKQDIGLYAMNYGNVYAASVAVYSSYSQVLQALVEADKFKGPSVVLAYLPYKKETSAALDILKETKLAVDAGYWPLYRWDPSKDREGKEPFSLDSDAVKNDLRQFLDRQNHLSQLVRTKPELAAELVSNLGDSVKEARRKKAQKAYDDLLVSLDAPPVLVLYASDGGAAEKVAKRLANRGKARGLTTSFATFDSVGLDKLPSDQHVILITSTAGQGEPPQNGRQFFKALNAAVSLGDKSLTHVRFTVFGMGDSHYWPRPEDAHYYNKPGKDLNARLEQLGAERFTDLGLGDDHDADGPETGYKIWEPLLWKALGVDAIEVTEAEPEPITNEHIKAASNYLRGTILEGLDDSSTGALAPSDGQLTKFHGIYQQDDRDIRDEREAQGVEPAFSFMIRVRMPGGVCTPQQWLQMDQIADEHGSGTFKITTRQTFQFHGVIKRHLKPAIQDINRVLLDTLAACGDVNRNVICSSIPTKSKLHAQVYEFCKSVSSHLIPQTTAYHEIWLDKKMVAGDAVKDFEPLYGDFYLPRKFKIAVAVPPNNDVDVFANDLGFIAIVDTSGELSGFNVAIGGGMGVTHGNKKTYPRIGDVIGFCTVDQGKYVAEKVMIVQRDNGNRADRKNARLKYTIDRMGLATFKSEVEKLLGYQLQPARPYSFDRNIDDFGWATGEDGRHHFTLFIENGRVQNEADLEFKTGLREIALVHKGTFRMTANQHIVVSDIATQDLPVIKRLLSKYKLDNISHTGLRLSSSACVAFPTCGLAMAESERYLPLLINKVEAICEENGLRNDSIVMRMTGCPNGCARPYVAEVAFVGKAPGSYMMLLGGGYYGQRMNKIYRETVTEPEILAILRPLIKHYALERLEGEHFGDFTIRAGYISATKSGLEWYEGMGGEGKYRESVAVSS